MNFTERPVFVSWITLLLILPMQLFFTVWAGGFFGGMVNGILGLKSSIPFIFFGAVAFFGFPMIGFFGKKLNYARTEYRFFDDHLEFEEGFFSQNKKIIRYRDIIEVTLRKGLLQRSCGLGTIYLATLATGSGPRANPFYALGFGNISASGVGVRDVAEPDAVFERVSRLIESARRGVHA